MRSLVLLLMFSVAVPALGDVNAPIHDDGLDRVGVLPFRVTGKSKKANRKDAALYFKLLLEVFDKERGSTVSLANPRERTLRARSKKAVVRAVRKRAKAAKVTRVLTGTVSGRKGRQYLELELFDMTGHRMSRYRLKPYQRLAGEWAMEAMEALVLSPPTPTPSPAASGPVEADKPGADVGPEPSEIAAPVASDVASEEVAPGGSSSLLWWTVGGAGIVLGAGALVGGGFAGAAAWEDSEALIKLPPGDPERETLEGSSIQKAVLADALFVSGAVLVAVGVAAGVVAFLGDDE